MLIDLVHNKIIEDTISEKFAESAEEGLVSLLAGRYGDRMLGIQLYEVITGTPRVFKEEVFLCFK